jgi:hypothetical protein
MDVPPPEEICAECHRLLLVASMRLQVQDTANYYVSHSEFPALNRQVVKQANSAFRDLFAHLKTHKL